MAKAPALEEDHVGGTEPSDDAGLDQAASHHIGQREHRSRFWRHLAEMMVVMVIGMIAAAAIFLTIVGVTWEKALVQYRAQSLLVVAAGMTLPMMAWMRFRGHSWRSSAEMGAAMALPVIPFLCLVWFDVTKSAQCGAYCVTSVAAMLVLMAYRRAEYATH